MSSLEALQRRLEVFREAGRNLQLDPLVTPEDLGRLGVEYQTGMIDELEQAVEDCVSQDNKLIFTGHRGCGKSTLLTEVGLRLSYTNRYFVVMFSISDMIEESAVDHVNVLFSIALQLLEATEERGIKLQPGIRKGFYQWLGVHTQTESKLVESEIEASTETAVKAGIPAIFEFLAKVKSKLRINSVIREEISTVFARRISDLVARINQLQAYIENATQQQVLVMIDDLDKLSLTVTQRIFGENIQSLLDPNCRILYTISIAALRDATTRNSINAFIKKPHTMRVAKLFSKATVRKVDRVPDQDCVHVLDQILTRRLPLDLIEDEVKQQIILLSGGVLRELIRMSDRCCDKAMQIIRRQIRQQQFDLPEVVVNQQILKEVVEELQVEYAEFLGQVDYDMLKLVYEEFKPRDVENKRFLDLLHLLYLLEYRNGSLWYDLNPIVRDLLVQEGVLDGTVS